MSRTAATIDAGPDLDWAREYLRVSLDLSGRERSNDEQHTENVVAAQENRWRLGTPYRDTGSASRHSRKARDDFDRLVSDLENDRFGAKVLILWESSRGSRQVGEWVRLIDLCDLRGVRIHVTTHNRTYDPGNARDRRSLLEDAVDSEYESSKLSVRLKRSTAAAAAAGRPHGIPPFGYRRTYDLRSGALVGQEPDPVEAPIVVEMFERFAAGESLRAISRDLEARGVRSRVRERDGVVIGGGVPISSESLRPLLLNIAYAGKRSWTPGRGNGKRNDAQATIVDAEWPALVPMTTWLAVRHRLSDPARKTSRPGRGVHLLSMIARCDVCGGVLAATYRHEGGRRQYQCHSGGHVRMNADELDEAAILAIVAFLENPDNADRFAAEDVDGSELFDARQAQAVIRAELEDLADKVGSGEVSATLAGRAEQGILARLRDADRRVEDLNTPTSLHGMLTPGDDVLERWEVLPMSTKREIARELLTPGMIGELRVTRSTYGGGSIAQPVAERVVWNTKP